MIVKMRKHDRRDTTPKAADGTPNGVLSRSGRQSFLPPSMILEPISRKPTVLPEATVRTVLDLSPGAARAAGFALPELLEPAVQDSFHRVSIVVITRDHLVFTKLCLESVLANTDYADFELIVVDNASGEELLSYLDQLTDRFPFIRVVRNKFNRGFATAINQGLVQATGDRFVLLNNDTIVPEGWLTPLVRHLDDPQVGAVGPVTNRTSNEAQIETSYRTYAEFEGFASEYTTAHAGERFDIPMLTMYCFAIRRETHSQVGPLDEAFHIAMFEDDDYALRLRSEGYRLVCAEDVFVHHFGGVSLGSLLESGECQELLKANRERFQRKWGVEWQSHRHRLGPAYQRLITGIREVVGKVIPTGAKVLVISKGDPELVDFEGRDARHFPVDADGAYAGYHPAGSTDAINHLKALQRRGAQYLVIPSPAFWWLEHYAGFADYLAGAGEETYRAADLCVIVHLPRPPHDRC
jgi:GT2 family glycosyltransferase